MVSTTFLLRCTVQYTEGSRFQLGFSMANSARIRHERYVTVGTLRPHHSGHGLGQGGCRCCCGTSS